MGDMTAKSLNNINAEATRRFSSTIPDLDWAYGTKGGWGIPLGKISLWSGEAGVGKSRLLAQIMKLMAKDRFRTMVAQGEVSAGQFKAEKFSNYKPSNNDTSSSDDASNVRITKEMLSNIYMTTHMDLESICSNILHVRPTIVFIDSIQTVVDSEAGIKHAIERFRKVIKETDTHIVLISQLNKDGTSKGTTTLPHLVDIEASLFKFWRDLPGGTPFFALQVNKNRYGDSGRQVAFNHRAWGVSVEQQALYAVQDSDFVGSEQLVKLYDESPAFDKSVITSSSNKQKVKNLKSDLDAYESRHLESEKQKLQGKMIPKPKTEEERNHNHQTEQEIVDLMDKQRKIHNLRNKLGIESDIEITQPKIPDTQKSSIRRFASGLFS
jgi:predicted ATP-dependent serine protease